MDTLELRNRLEALAAHTKPWILDKSQKAIWREVCRQAAKRLAYWKEGDKPVLPPIGTPRTDAFVAEHVGRLPLVSFARQLERELWAVSKLREAAERTITRLESTPSATPATDYICKCGVRVTPHRCGTSTDF